MTDNIYDKEKAVLVAIDIAKKSHDILICQPTGKRKHLKIPNSLARYKELLLKIGTDGCPVRMSEPLICWFFG